MKGPNRNEARRGLTHQTHEIVWTSRSRSIPRRPVWFRPSVQSLGTRRAQNFAQPLGLPRRARLHLSPWADARRRYSARPWTSRMRSAQLALELVASLDGPRDADAKEAWVAEIELRAHRALSDPDGGEDWSAARADIQSKLRAP